MKNTKAEVKDSYDVVVIGAGSAGLTAAVGFNNIGKSVLLIENQHMGGECTNSGCIPSKSLLHHAKQYYSAKKQSGDTEKLQKYRDTIFSLVRENRDEILSHEQPHNFIDMGIDVYFGQSEFSSRNTLLLDRSKNQIVTFKKSVVATGSSPRTINIDGLRNSDILTNQNFFEQSKLPEKLLVIGGGPIGLELGQAMAMLGTSVTILTNEKRFLSRYPKNVSNILEKNLADLSVKIITDSSVDSVSDSTALITNSNKETVSVDFDKVLMAVGRVPVFPASLGKAGVSYLDHGIETNNSYQTSNKNIYASGDVTLRDKFTHTADDASRMIVSHSFSKWLPFTLFGTKKSHAVIPKVTYTYPEIASVGMDEKSAHEYFGKDSLITLSVPFSKNDRAHTDEQSENGMLIITAKKFSGKIVGATIIGQNAGETLSLLTYCIKHKVSMYRLRSLIFPYPTISLIIKKAADQFLAGTARNIKPDLIALAKRKAPQLFALVFWLIILCLFYGYKTANNLSFQQMISMFFTFVQSNPAGPLIYIVAYAIRPIIFFPATLMTLLSGAIFGLWAGALYTMIGENMSASVAYWIGRFFGKDLKIDDGLFGPISKNVHDNSFVSVLIARFAFFPFDLTNYVSGIIRIKYVPYVLATIIGIIPGMMTFVAAGASIENIAEFNISEIGFDWQMGLLALSLFVSSLIVAKLTQRFFTK